VRVEDDSTFAQRRAAVHRTVVDRWWMVIPDGSARPCGRTPRRGLAAGRRAPT